MHVIGTGFLAGHLRHAIGDRHPGVIAIAAGVSSTSVTDPAAFAREADLVRDVARQAAARDQLVVFFSTASSAMYGSAGSSGAERDPVFPTSWYGRHKLALERELAAGPADRLVLRLSHVIGAGQRRHQLLPSLVEQMRSGTITVHRGAYRDLVDVRHVVDALDGLLTAGVRGAVVNVASGVPQPVELIVEGVRRRLGCTPEPRIVDAPGDPRPVSIALLRELVPDVARFGFGPGYLDDVLDRYVPVPATGSPNGR